MMPRLGQLLVVLCWSAASAKDCLSENKVSTLGSPKCKPACDVGSLGTGISESNSGLIVGPYLQSGTTYYEAVVGTTLTVPESARTVYSIKTATTLVSPYAKNMIARLWGPSTTFANAAASGALSWDINAPGTDTPLLATSPVGVLGETVGTKNKMTFTFPSAVNVTAGSTVFVTFEIQDAKALFDAEQVAGGMRSVSCSVAVTGSTDEEVRIAQQNGAGVTFQIDAAAGVVVRRASSFAQYVVGFECVTDVDGCLDAPCSAGGDVAAVCTDRALPKEGAECACSSSSFVGPLCDQVCGVGDSVGSLGTGISESNSGLIVGPYLQSGTTYYDSVVGTTLTVPAQVGITAVTALVPPYAKNMIARLWGPSTTFANAAASGALSWNISAPGTDTPLLATSPVGVLGETVGRYNNQNKMTFTFPSAVNVAAGSTVFVTFEIQDAKALFDAKQASGSRMSVSVGMKSTGRDDEEVRIAQQNGAGVTFQINAAAGVVVRRASSFVQYAVSFACRASAPTPRPKPKPKPRRKKRVVVRTTLKGFSVASFSAGLRFAFRMAWARLCNVDVVRVTIANIRDASKRRRLSGGISFDVEVSSNTAEDATHVAAEIKSHATDSAVMDSFNNEIDAVSKAGSFDDVPSNYEMPAGATLNVGEATVEDEPSAGEGDGGDSASPVPIVVGVVGGALVVAAAAFFVRHRRRNAPKQGEKAMEGVEMSTPSSDPSLEDVYGGTNVQNAL